MRRIPLDRVFGEAVDLDFTGKDKGEETDMGDPRFGTEGEKE